MRLAILFIVAFGSGVLAQSTPPIVQEPQTIQHPIELSDIQRAIRTLRSRAAEWHLAPDRIGVMGFSACGHLASTASTQFDRRNTASADAIDRAVFSTDALVTTDTPPTFLFHTNADTSVPVENSVYYFLALRKAGVPAEMHIFKDGAHGAGMPMNDTALSEWPKVLANWMRASGFL